MTKSPTPGEFEVIARYFAPLTTGRPGAFGLTDDGAVIDVPADCQLATTVDAMVAGVHFLPTDPADLVARKLLRVNLSDLAAMGARPFAYLLTIALDREIDATWLESFSAGLAADQAGFDIVLVGGDTVRTPGPVTLSITALGLVDAGKVLRRDGARVGDTIFLSGTVGDGALGLRVLRQQLQGLNQAMADHLVDRYRLPQPRTALGPRLPGLATAGLDVSDGLVADLAHICALAGAGAVIEVDRLPLSDAARAALQSGLAPLQIILSGGDDYELLFTAPTGAAEAVASLAAELEMSLTAIGRVVAGGGVRVIGADGVDLVLESSGYRHF